MPPPYRVKICGTTNTKDALLAAKAGADYFGVVVEVDFSPRSLTVEQARPLFAAPPIPAVALVYQMPEDRIRQLLCTLDPFAVQFLGDTDTKLLKRIKRDFSTSQIWQSIHLPPVGETVALEDLCLRVEEYVHAGIDALLLDTAFSGGGQTRFGGTGVAFDWNLVRSVMPAVPEKIPLWLAGGINPENVTEALHSADPFGIDLCSGVEARPGKKDPDKVNRLMDAIRFASQARRTIT